MSKFRELLTKDAGWKLLSVFIAVCLWFVVINMENPVEYRVFTANIDIVSKTDVSGIDIYIKPGTVNESVHIPVVLKGFRKAYGKTYSFGQDSAEQVFFGIY